MTEDYTPAADAESQAIAVTGLGTLIGELKWKLPGCDDLEIRKTLGEVFREFCRTTSALTWERSFPITQELLHLRVGIPFSCIADSLASVALGGREVCSRNYTFSNDGASVHFHFSRDWLESVLTDDDQHRRHRLNMKLVLVPMVGAESAPTQFMQAHSEAFVAGALARLTAMQGKPWHSPSVSALNADTYSNLCSVATLRQMHDGGATGNIPNSCKIRRLPL